MAKRGENIRKRKDGRWEARYKKGRKPDGSILYGYVYAHKYSEAKEKRDAAIREWDDTHSGATHLETVTTFHELFDKWKLTARHSVKESSYCLYETIIEKHLRPCFGNMQLLQFHQENYMQEFISMKIDEQLSPSYIHTILIVFKNILKQAKAQKYLTEDIPVYQLPKIYTTREIFTIQEWTALESYLKNQKDSFSFGLLLCMYTGIRIGELSGLKWEDFDLINHQILIRRTIYRIKNHSYNAANVTNKTALCVGSPKTETSRRNIPFPTILLNAILHYIKTGENFVLTGTVQCMEPRSIQRKYKKILKICGLRYLTFHSLRHSFATIALQKGFDCKTLSEILGHASVNTTLNIYVHSSIEQKRRNMELFFKNQELTELIQH